AMSILDEILASLQSGSIQGVGAATTRNFFGPLQAIIPWASNYFTEQLIGRVKEQFGGDFWGFWMLGGMSGGGMGFIFDPARKPEGREFLQAEMTRLRGELRNSLPFAMDPVVYDFAINPAGTTADLLADDALLPRGYYAQLVPRWLREDPRAVPASKRGELDRLGQATRRNPDLSGLVESLFDRMLPSAPAAGGG